MWMGCMAPIPMHFTLLLSQYAMLGKVLNGSQCQRQGLGASSCSNLRRLSAALSCHVQLDVEQPP